jgi:Family of unknown function (DUF5995)
MLTADWPASMTGVAERVKMLDPDRTLDAVADRLLAIERDKRGFGDPSRSRFARRPDGVACFNYLYLRVTQEVLDSRGSFESPAFVERLAVVFAEFYLEAYEAASAGEWVSKAWEPLFERKDDKGIPPLQFALTGMNAHINNDLPWALLQAWDEFGLEPSEDSAVYRDFELVDAILARAQGEVRARLESGVLRWLDRVLGRLDDLVASFKVAKARREAWDRGARWSRRFDAEAAAAHERYVGYTSHLILAF